MGIQASKSFMENPNGPEVLIEAAGFLKKPSKKLYDFLNSQAQLRDDSGQVNAVVGSLIRIQTPEAIELARRYFDSKDYSKGSKDMWLTYFVVYHRTEQPVIGLYQHLFKTIDQKNDLKKTIVDTLFDFRPREWYGLDGYDPRIMRAPDWSKASTEVLQQTLQLAQQSLKWDISASTKASVRKAQKEIGEILAKREKKKA